MKIKEYLIRIKSYSLESLKAKHAYPGAVNFRDLIRYFPEWWNALSPQRNSLDDTLPWIAFSATNFLEKILDKEVLVFEFGSGGSTLFFAKKVKEVFSVEHDKEWFEKVSGVLKKSKVDNVEISLLQPTKDINRITKSPANPDAYISGGERYKGMSFENYAKSIDKFPNDYFDIILIDGRARPSCFKHSVNKIKVGGHLILDNAERSHYSYIHDRMSNDGWQKYDFPGPFHISSIFPERVSGRG